MKYFILILAIFLCVLSCSDDNNLLKEGETTKIEEDTSLTSKVANWALFKDTVIEETGTIVEMAFDSSLLSSVATVATGESLSINAEGKIRLIMVGELNPIVMLPVNLPENYENISFIKFTYSPTKMELSASETKVIALKSITEYDISVLN